MTTNNQINTSKPFTIAVGGTGVTSTTAYGILAGGTTSTSPIQNIGVGTSGYVLTSNGAGMLASWQPMGSNNSSVVVQVFTTSGTYTPTVGMTYCTIEVIGGGAGSGGTSSTGSNQQVASGGGGGGGYARKTVSAATIGASQTVTIGAGGTAGSAGNNNGGNGGTTSVGSIVSATGGNGGAGGNATSTSTVSGGGSGGAGISGDFNTVGTPGGPGFATVGGTLALSGFGGSSFFGGGSAQAESAAHSYGGGAGGWDQSGSMSAHAGFAGFAGIAIITEYVAG